MPKSWSETFCLTISWFERTLSPFDPGGLASFSTVPCMSSTSSIIHHPPLENSPQASKPSFVLFLLTKIKQPREHVLVTVCTREGVRAPRGPASVSSRCAAGVVHRMSVHVYATCLFFCLSSTGVIEVVIPDSLHLAFVPAVLFCVCCSRVEGVLVQSNCMLSTSFERARVLM